MPELEPHRIVRLEDDAVVVLDQRRLPEAEVELRCGSAHEVAEAIRVLAVRGAPAIGVAAAYGMALAAARGEDLDRAFATLASSRPTAVNLRWALEAMRDDPTRERAERIHADEVERCRRMGEHAVALFPAGARVLTHCNAGGLATGGYGSAVGAIRAARRGGPRRARLGGRDATAAPGRPAHRLGARAARDPARGDRRRCGGSR